MDDEDDPKPKPKQDCDVSMVDILRINMYILCKILGVGFGWVFDFSTI